MITIITILVSTTTSVELTYAIEDSLGVFKFVKAPVTE
jgi:energy-coupling factor transporter transmembrane protein EcfT